MMLRDHPGGGSICVGCGCTDEFACEHGCSWLACYRGVGLCSSCEIFRPSWAMGARFADWLPIPVPDHPLLNVQLGGGQVHQYAPGTGQAAGHYYTVDEERGTLRLVDEQGRPALGNTDFYGRSRRDQELRLTWVRDWAVEMQRKGRLSRGPTPDEVRAERLKLERRRAKAKAAKKAKQTARRSS